MGVPTCLYWQNSMFFPNVPCKLQVSLTRALSKQKNDQYNLFQWFLGNLFQSLHRKQTSYTCLFSQDFYQKSQNSIIFIFLHVFRVDYHFSSFSRSNGNPGFADQVIIIILFLILQVSNYRSLERKPICKFIDFNEIQDSRGKNRTFI